MVDAFVGAVSAQRKPVRRFGWLRDARLAESRFLDSVTDPACALPVKQVAPAGRAGRSPPIGRARNYAACASKIAVPLGRSTQCRSKIGFTQKGSAIARNFSRSPHDGPKPSPAEGLQH